MLLGMWYSCPGLCAYEPIQEVRAGATRQYESHNGINRDWRNSNRNIQKIIARPNFGKGHVWNQVNAASEAFKAYTGDVIFCWIVTTTFSNPKSRRSLQHLNSIPMPHWFSTDSNTMTTLEGSIITLQNKFAAYCVHTTNWSAQPRSDDFLKKIQRTT